MNTNPFRISATAALILAVLLAKPGECRGQDSKVTKSLKITSSAFHPGGDIPPKFSREGGNVSPPLLVEGTPAEARSLVLIMDDPDAPVGLFTHWLVWNIDPRTTQIAEQSVPKGGIQGTNDFSALGYAGPQPPSGRHRYYVKVFALDQTIDLPSGTRRKELDRMIRGHIIAQGELMGYYSRGN